MGLFTAVLAAAFVVQSARTQPPTAPPPRPATDPELAKHLAAWKEAAGERESVRAAVSVNRTDGSFGTEVRYSGGFVALKPNMFRLRLTRDDDAIEPDSEMWVCDGETLFWYEGRPKTVVEIPLKSARGRGHILSPTWLYDLVASRHPGELFALRCLTGLDPGQYQVSLLRDGQGTLDLELVPHGGQEKLDFERAIVRLTGPDAKTPYVPTQVHVARRNRDVEVWRFDGVRTDVMGVGPRHFRFEPVPGFKHVRPYADPAKPDRR